MGERCKVAVYDLDGTLIKGSSFNQFIWFILIKLFKSGDYQDGLIILYYFFLQALRLKTRANAKFYIMQIADNHCSADDYINFANIIVNKMRRDLINQLLGFHKYNVFTILLSASPDQYVAQIASILKFDCASGTPMSLSWEKYSETRGERKAQILKELLPKNSKVDFVFTDHHDDFILIDFCKGATVNLINPSRQLKSLCDSFKVNYKINIQHD